MSASSVPPSNLLSPRERAEAALRRGPSSAAAAGSSAGPPPHSHRSLLAARALATRQAASAGSERRGGKKRAASASGSGRGGNARGKRPATAVPSSDDDDDDDQAADDHFTTAPRSEREETATRFTRHCREGCNGVRGILAKRGPDKLELLPYAHQWEGVRRATAKEAMLWMYDAGLGKTAMAVLLLAALEQQKKDAEGRHVGGCNMICIVPPSCLQQWEDTMHCWLATRGKTPGGLGARPDLSRTSHSGVCFSPVTYTTLGNPVLGRGADTWRLSQPRVGTKLPSALGRTAGGGSM